MRKRPLYNVKAENFLSLENIDVDLGNLSVLVGPNGSGKTNFLKIFSFIGEIAERDLVPAIETLGGTQGLPFQNGRNSRLKLSIAGTITQLSHSRALDEYTLSVDPQRLKIKGHDVVFRKETFKFKRVEGRGRRITIEGGDLQIYDRTSGKRVGKEDVNKSTSGLAVLRRLGRRYDADQVEEFAQLFLSLRLIDINVRRVREPSRLTTDTALAADGSNVGQFLIRLAEQHPEAFDDIQSDMRAVLPTFERFVFSRSGGGDDYIRISVKEKVFDEPIPLDRTSFGTIRAIVLFSMLHDPDPPRLTCIEEIDHGFHPQALDRLVIRLREATERTQIIVATHSPALVNRINADELVLFRRDVSTGGTRIERPDPDFVAKARQEFGYELGELWFAGLLDV